MKLNNIMVSGWPGAGASTIAFLLAYRLKFTLLRGTETFRYLGKLLENSDTGRDRIDNDNFLEPHFGPVFDKYIDYKLQNGKNLVMEADIGAFRLGKREEYYSIFVAASDEVRKQRLGADGRQLDQEVLTERQNDLRERYKELHNIDWFSLVEINEKYNFYLDNSNRSIAEEMGDIYNKLFNDGKIDESRKEELMATTISDEEEYFEKGKKWYLEFLKNNNQLMDGPEVIAEIKQIFPDDIDKLPDILKKFF